MLDIINHISIASNEATNRSKTFAERPHYQVNFVGQIEMGRRTSPTTGHTDTVRVIDHDTRAITLADFDNFGQRRNITAHAVDTIDHNQFARFGRQFAQNAV
mgnify:CR=1 FL=1